MTQPLRRIVVTGARGRLGSALMGAIAEVHGLTALPWSRPAYDLDGTDAAPLLDRDRPDLVIHAAAWTDVDGCARDPDLAMRRNADAVDRLARACAARGVRFALVSTNEVFDGRRGDGRGYVESDPPSPVNAYGRSKLAGEDRAREAFVASDGGEVGLWIVRTAWLYGPPGSDFPTKIIAASDRLGDEALPVVMDETGSPTFARDLARGILDLLAATHGGTFHLVNRGRATRFEWAKAVLDACRPGRTLRPISQADFDRDSPAPAWGVLDDAKAISVGVRLRDWREALAGYLDELS